MAQVMKASVKYRPNPAGWLTGHQCADCVMFRPAGKEEREGTCTLVAGPIKASFVCDRWVGK